MAEATLHRAPGLAKKKRPDLRIDAVLGERAPEDWQGILDPHVIEGSDLRETVLVHALSRTVISADLVEKLLRLEPARPRGGRDLAGAGMEPDGAGSCGSCTAITAPRSIDALLERDRDHVILAHGDPIEREGHAVVREAYRWLRA